jgi:tight adherence protein B
MIWLATGMAFMSVMALMLALEWLLFSAERKRVEAQRRRLGEVGSKDAQAAGRLMMRDRSLSTNRLLTAFPKATDVQLLLHQAGNPCNLGTLVLLIAVGAAMGLLVGAWRGHLILALGLAVGGGWLPVTWLKHLRKSRLKAFDEQFPDAVELMARALRAGHSFGSALRMVGEEMDDPMAAEFNKTFDDYSFGKGLEDALGDLVERVGLQDLKFFVTAVILQKETGGNLAEILDNIGYIIRERFQLMRQIRTLSAEGRLSGIILSALPPLLLGALLIMSPGYIDLLFTHPTGQLMLILGAVFQVMGMLVIRALVNIKV